MKEEYRPIREIKFDQANKKDAIKVTAGKYTMSTTKKGRYIQRVAPYDVQLKKLWRIGPESARLTLNYRMGHTLEEMGIELKPTDWSRVVVRKSSCTPPGSVPTTPTSDSSPAPDDESTSTAFTFNASRPSILLGENCSKDIIRFTSTEIKLEKDLGETQIAPVNIIATN